MSLDFICQETNQRIYDLDDGGFYYLKNALDEFSRRTGVVIDPYGDTVLDNNYQQILIDSIDYVIDSIDLNQDKSRNLFMVEFRGVLKYFIRKRISVVCYGD